MSEGRKAQGETRELGRIRILSSVQAWDRVGRAWLKSTDADSTERTYEWEIRRFFAWCERNGVDALDPGREGIDGYRRAQRRKGNQRPTIARKLSTLSSFYGYAVIDGAVTLNPLDLVHRPKVSRESNRSGLDLDETLEVLDRAAKVGGRDEAVVCLLAWTGVRVAELRTATVPDLGHERGERVLTVTRKGGKRQTVMVERRAWVPLAAYLDGRADGPLIVGARGGPISRYEVAGILDRIVPDHIQRQKRITPHSMRHTCITLCFDAGADPLEVQRMMGHSSMETTMRYNHARDRVDRSPAHALAKLLGGPVAAPGGKVE